MSDHRLRLQIAGIGYEFVTRDATLTAAARLRFSDSLDDSGGQRRLTTRMEQERGRSWASEESARITVDGDLVELCSATGVEATVDLRNGTADLVLGDRVDAALENYLRMINAVLILERGGIQMHSAGVVRADEGYVFFGPADAGKSTTAGLSSQFQVLSDDQNVIMLEGETVVLRSVPFRSAFCPAKTSSGRAPLKRLLRLRQDTENRLEPISRPEAVALVAAQCPFVNFQPQLIDRLLENCDRIVERVPPLRMHFTKGPEFWQIL